MRTINCKGFTLIEVLAVIVILVIIVAIAIPNLEPIVKRQECNLLDTKVQLIKDQAKFYIDDNWSIVRKNLSNDDGSYYTSCKINVTLNENNSGLPSDIISNGYLTAKDLTDDNDEISGYVIYDNDTKKYDFCFIEGFKDCNSLSCNEKEVPSNDCK